MDDPYMKRSFESFDMMCKLMFLQNPGPTQKDTAEDNH